MPAKSKLEGRVFSRLTVIKEGKRHLNKRMWDCLCSCGKEFTTRGDSLLNGRVRSCGCLRSDSLRTDPPIGKLFGKLTVLGEGKRQNNRLYWEMGCCCGTVKDIRPDCILSGATISCGCYGKTAGTTHGMSYTSEYRSLRGLNGRCNNPKYPGYPWYGARGIRTCDRWNIKNPESLDNFMEDMGKCPEGHSLERLDVNGNYSKDNCIWATIDVQSANKRKYENNTTGRTGVYFVKDIDIWRATINHKSIRYDLGRFISFEDAVKAREEAELKYFGFIKK